MKDIDFDELDRAVGSVLGTDTSADATTKATAPAVATATDPDPVTTATPISTTDSTADASESAQDNVELTEAAEDSSSTSGDKSAISPARKRGQFLDMVHPSADMRKTPKMSTPARKTLEPLSTAVVPEPSDPQPENETAPSTVAAPTESAPEEAETTQEAPKDGSWPDPLDFKKESAEAAIAAQETLQTPAVDEPAEEVAQTPFVSDAKVDKRPLGAFAPQEDAASTEDPVVEAVAQPVDLKEETPEFSPEVNSIESAGVPQVEGEAIGLTGEVPQQAPTVEEHVEAVEAPTPVVETAPAPVDPQPEVTDEPEKPAQPVAEPVTTEPAEPAVAAAAPVAGQAASIPQQYKTAEQPKEADDARPLFDTEEYHQPLLADGKKKPTKIILLVIMLIVLLALGGALGYIAYNIGI